MKLHAPSDRSRLLTFALVGTLNSAICYALYGVLLAFKWHYNLALLADYAFAACCGYPLHRWVTFADRERLRQAFGKYSLSLGLTFGVNLLLLDGLLWIATLRPLAAQALAMTLATLAGNWLQLHWVFRSHPAAPLARTDMQAPAILRRAA